MGQNETLKVMQKSSPVGVDLPVSLTPIYGFTPQK